MTNTRHAVIDSPLGELTLVADGAALIGLYFRHHWYRPSADTFGPRVDAGSDALLAESQAQLDDYLTGVTVPVISGCVLHTNAYVPAASNWQ